MDRECSSGRGTNVIDGNSSHQSGYSFLSIDSGRDDMGEDGGLGGQSVKGRQLQSGKAPFVDLFVGEFVQYDPDDALLRGRTDRGGLTLMQSAGSVESVGLPGAPEQLKYKYGSTERGKCE